MIDRTGPVTPLDPGSVFATFDEQDSGCVAWGVEHDGDRWFVKVATTPAAAASLGRAVAFHRAVRHPAIVAPVAIVERWTDVWTTPPPIAERFGSPAAWPTGPALVHPWHAGEVLNRATVDGSDRARLARFRRLPVSEVTAAVTAVLDAHVTVVAAGFVAVDLYDGCFLYDPAERAMRLVDLDEYRPGPFVVDGDRLPGSTTFMAPEELTSGATIDELTTVFDLGRTILHLLDDGDGRFRGTAAQAELAAAATRPVPSARLASVRELHTGWLATLDLR